MSNKPKMEIGVLEKAGRFFEGKTHENSVGGLP
jgi:hypothetical protein